MRLALWVADFHDSQQAWLHNSQPSTRETCWHRALDARSSHPEQKDENESRNKRMEGYESHIQASMVIRAISDLIFSDTSTHLAVVFMVHVEIHGLHHHSIVFLIRWFCSTSIQ